MDTTDDDDLLYERRRRRAHTARAWFFVKLFLIVMGLVAIVTVVNVGRDIVRNGPRTHRGN